MDYTTPPEDTGVKRRTIMTGAAWTIPAIAIATAAPAQALSGPIALAFNQTSYAGTVCKAVTGAYVTVTQGGTPLAGASVTITSANGYSFDAGRTSYTGVSGSNGRVSVPVVRVHNAGTTGTLSATSGTTTTSSTLTSPSTSAIQTARYRMWLPDGSTYPNASRNTSVPAGAIAYGPRTTIDPSGALRLDADILSTSATSAYSQWVLGDDFSLTYVDATGVHYRYYTRQGTLQTASSFDAAIPAGAVVVGPHTTLDPAGVLRVNDRIIESGVTSATSAYERFNSLVLTWVDATGMHYRYWYESGTELTAARTDIVVPVGSIAVGPRMTVDPSGALRIRDIVIATGVSSTVAFYDKDDWLSITYIDATGMHYRFYTDQGVLYTQASADVAVPPGTIAVGPRITLDPSGVLRNTSTSLATGVTSASGTYTISDDSLTVTWVDGNC